METREQLLATGLRYDPQRVRQSVRKPRDAGVWVFIPVVELEKAGIDRNAPPPTYRIWSSEAGRGSVQLRFYR